MKTHFFLFLLLLSGCNAIEQAVQKLRGTSETTIDSGVPVYPVVPPPSLENDKVVQFSAKDRLLALLEQFNSSPDENLLALTVDGFAKQKQVFGLKRDPALVSALNGTIAQVQARNKNAVQLLVQLHAVLIGENQAFLRTVLARGFDHAPAMTGAYLLKFGQDTTCSLAAVAPEELSSEEKFSFFENRLNAVAPARLVTGQPPVYAVFMDACVSQLRGELSRLGVPSESQPAEPTAEPTASEPPAEPSTTEAAKPTNP